MLRIANGSVPLPPCARNPLGKVLQYRSPGARRPHRYGTMNYTIVTNAGKVIEFSTDLSVTEAYQVVAELPRTDFLDWVLGGRDKNWEKNNLWALKVAQETLDARNPAPESTPETVGAFLNLVTTVNRMQEGAKRQVILRFEGATVKAVTKGVNTGYAYVYYPTGAYAGKITPAGVFNGDSKMAEALSKAAENPQEAAVAYGRQTGNCSCCGRGLTDPVSIFGGIGPICLGRLAGPDARAELEADYREHQASALLDQVLATV